jgi:hypothetical protein
VIEASLPSEKFTGAVTIPSPTEAARPTEKPTEKPAEIPRKQPETEPRAPETAAPTAYEQPSAMLYEIGGGSGGAEPDGSSAWIIAYGIGLTGAIVVALLRRKR